jgi:coenzyme F420-reducing hydrogenase gamma subunit
LVLERRGYEVLSSYVAAGLERCKAGAFDILILEGSVSETEKKKLIDASRHCSVPVISVTSSADVPPAGGADYYSGPDPEELFGYIAEIVNKKAAINRAAS